jgi:glycerol-3-phosphate dehydrogenase
MTPSIDNPFFFTDAGEARKVSRHAFIALKNSYRRKPHIFILGGEWLVFRTCRCEKNNDMAATFIESKNTKRDRS